MYGPPGNGKSSISNGIRDAIGDKIYVPRALEYAGQVITSTTRSCIRPPNS
jgi:replication-associated recombination protein RarA